MRLEHAQVVERVDEQQRLGVRGHFVPLDHVHVSLIDMNNKNERFVQLFIDSFI